MRLSNEIFNEIFVFLLLLFFFTQLNLNQIYHTYVKILLKSYPRVEHATSVSLVGYF